MKSLEKLTEIQTRLLKGLIVEDRFRKPIRSIAGVDLAFIDDKAVAACVTLDYDSLEVIEQKTSVANLDFPYHPGLLWFREGPALLKVIRRIRVEPDIFMVNAHGIAHPRRFGCASHLGVRIGRPTIGVAGSRLSGKYEHLPTEFCESSPLMIHGERVGWVVKPREGKPIYISPGHMVSVDSALRVALYCLRDKRFPEPIWLSHRLANSRKRELTLKTRLHR